MAMTTTPTLCYQKRLTLLIQRRAESSVVAAWGTHKNGHWAVGQTMASPTARTQAVLRQLQVCHVCSRMQ